MRTAAHHMVRNVTAGMSMITCREPLLTALTNNIKNSLMAALRVSPVSSCFFYCDVHQIMQIQGTRSLLEEPNFVKVSFNKKK